MVHDADAELFAKTIEKAVAVGILKGKVTAIIDFSPVHGAGTVADTYELIGGFIRQVVRTAGERRPRRSGRSGRAPGSRRPQG